MPTRILPTLLFFAADCGCAHVTPTAAPADTPAAHFRALIPTDLPVADTPPDPPEVFVGAPEDREFGVRIELELSRGGAPFQAVPIATPLCNGDFVAFRFTPNAAGTATVINHGTSGRWQTIWPAREWEDPTFTPDRPARIPAQEGAGFPVSGPPGTEYVLILFSPGPFSDAHRRLQAALLGAGAAAPGGGLRFLVPSGLVPAGPDLAVHAVGQGEQAVAFALEHRADCPALPTQGVTP